MKKMRILDVLQIGLAVCLGLVAADNTRAASVEADTNPYVLVDLAACKKPPLAPPALPATSYEQYDARRRFVNLDGSGQCVLLDFWIERLGGSPSAGMRVLEHRYLRFTGGKWQPFVAAFTWYPYALKERTTGKVYLVDAPTEEDLGDFMVLKTGVPRVFTTAGWISEKGFNDSLALQEVTAGRAEILLALARRLEPHATPARDPRGAERARIRMLREAATGKSP